MTIGDTTHYFKDFDKSQPGQLTLAFWGRGEGLPATHYSGSGTGRNRKTSVFLQSMAEG